MARQLLSQGGNAKQARELLQLSRELVVEVDLEPITLSLIMCAAFRPIQHMISGWRTQCCMKAIGIRWLPMLQVMVAATCVRRVVDW